MCAWQEIWSLDFKFEFKKSPKQWRRKILPAVFVQVWQGAATEVGVAARRQREVSPSTTHTLVKSFSQAVRDGLG